MALNPVPQPTQTLPQTQNPILVNFATIDTDFSKNHVPFNNGGPTEGMHAQLQMPQQTVDSTTTSTQIALYAKAGTGGVTQLFYRPISNGTPIQFTAIGNGTTGWTQLPSGLIMKWGTSTVGANTTDTATFDTTKPFTTVLNVQVSMQGQSGRTGTLYYQSFTTTQLIVYRTTTNSSPIGYNYFVIGV